MEKKTHSPQFLQQRKFMLVLPLLALPFITLMFWALDGGKTSSDPVPTQTLKKGLNLELPAAYLQEDQPLNKLSYYEKAAADSAKLEKLIKNDPYYKKRAKSAPKEKARNDSTRLLALKANKATSVRNSHLNTSLSGQNTTTDPLEAQVYLKLEQLNSTLQKVEAQPTVKPTSFGTLSNHPNNAQNQNDIDRLERMMLSMKREEDGEDPEMQQLNGMLEKILDIQHPARVQAKLQNVSATVKNQLLPVAVNRNEPVSLLAREHELAIISDSVPATSFSSNGFYSLEEEGVPNFPPHNVIPAVVQETQTLGEGSVVKLRLTGDVSINGVLIPAGNFGFGIASLNGERLNIKINSIRYQDSLFPVGLLVFDLDGLNGIYIPGAITREVAQQAADRAVQGVGLTTFDPSLGAQAASAGIEAAKTLFNKKAKRVKVTVKAGYQVLLQDQKPSAAS